MSAQATTDGEAAPRPLRPWVRAPQVYVEVEAEIDTDQLHEQGWHHEDECPAMSDPDPTTAASLRHAVRESEQLVDTIADLHRQAHPGQSLRREHCQLEPCRTLTDGEGGAFVRL